MKTGNITLKPLGFPWPTRDPFLFCVHHLDRYPEGNEQLGPKDTLADRMLGMDFDGLDGWRMYHGHTVPGFPPHPHRGFETVTLVRKGFVDHSDSLGATARFGKGDVQWLTAGRGIVHSEMFPLLRQDEDNPLELFQIWLNLPGKNKMVDPHFSMFWRPQIPSVEHVDGAGKRTSITVVAGELGSSTPPAPPPRSWAADPDNEVAIWAITMEPGATWQLPAASDPITNRTLFFFEGDRIAIDGAWISSHSACDFDAPTAARIENGDSTSELLLLQGRPIAEPIAQHGPFVMNTTAEILQAMSDYRRTEFGGWPWQSEEPVHGPDARRFARLPNGEMLRPEEDEG